MKKYFHVDMANRLKPGMIVNPLREGPSSFGSVYWQKFRDAGIHSIPDLQGAIAVSSRLQGPAYREFWLEVIRTDHPEILTLSPPSRLNSFFAWDSIEDAHLFAGRSKLKRRATIYEVYSEDLGSRHDMNWLDHEFPRDVRKISYYYICYWHGKKIKEDPHLSSNERRASMMEVLLTSELTIGNGVGRIGDY